MHSVNTHKVMVMAVEWWIIFIEYDCISDQIDLCTIPAENLLHVKFTTIMVLKMQQKLKCNRQSLLVPASVKFHFKCNQLALFGCVHGDMPVNISCKCEGSFVTLRALPNAPSQVLLPLIIGGERSATPSPEMSLQLFRYTCDRQIYLGQTRAGIFIVCIDFLCRAKP